MTNTSDNLGKPEKALQILLDGNPSYRGAAYLLLKKAGLGDEGGIFFKETVKAFEAKTGTALGEYPRKKDGKMDAEQLRKAHTMEFYDVAKHAAITGKNPDKLFWACWSLYKDGKWNGELNVEIFTAHFTSKKVEVNEIWAKQCAAKLDAAQSIAQMDYTQAYTIVAKENNNTSAPQIKQVLSEWQKEHGMLPRSAKNQARHDMRVRSHRMSAEQVRCHVESLQESGEKAGELFWQTWKLYKEGKWAGELEKTDFEPLFEKKNRIEEGVAQWRRNQAGQGDRAITM